MRAGRLSRAKKRLSGIKLRGLNAKTYYQIQKLTDSNIVAAAKKYLPGNIWTKFDRGKPLTDQQIRTVYEALNRAMMDRIEDYPFTSILIKLRYEYVLTKKGQAKVWGIKDVHIVRLPSLNTDRGNAFVVDDSEILTHEGQAGQITFSSHAIERLVERIPEIKEFSQKESMIALKMLGTICKTKEVQKGDDGHPMLVFSLCNRILGFFPIVYCDKNVWICTTFLEPEMHGTPKTEEMRSLCR